MRNIFFLEVVFINRLRIYFYNKEEPMKKVKLTKLWRYSIALDGDKAQFPQKISSTMLKIIFTMKLYFTESYQDL